MYPRSPDGKRKVATEPLQRRSRETHEKLLKVAEQLILVNGADFTLADLAQQSGVSIGGVYRRFPDKEALIVALQKLVYRRMDDEFGAVEKAALQRSGDFRQQLDVVVLGWATLLKNYSPYLKAFIEASLTFSESAREGFKAYLSNRNLSKSILLTNRAAIAHPDPEHAIEFCYNCVFEIVASHLGFARRNLPDHSKWPALIADLQRLCQRFLLDDARSPLAAPERTPATGKPAGRKSAARKIAGRKHQGKRR
jgi:AcrR family transcriptional regulator